MTYILLGDGRHSALDTITAKHRTYAEMLTYISQESQSIHLGVEIPIIDELEVK